MRDPNYVPTPEDTVEDVIMATIAGAGLGLIAYGVVRMLRSVRMSA